MNNRWIYIPTIILSLVFSIGFSVNNQRPTEYLQPQLASIEDSAKQTEIIPLEIVTEMKGEVNQDRILTDLRRLTGVEPICLNNECRTITSRLTGTPNLQLAKDYVYEVLTSLGYSVEIQDWENSGSKDQNLIVRKMGLIYPGEEIYFIAHLDTSYDCPGADDNASGVVSLLELARILKNHILSRTVVLLITTGEERGDLGAESYVNQLTPEELSAIKYAINVDMLGYDANQDGVMELLTGGTSDVFVQLLFDTMSAYELNLTPQIYTSCG